MNTVNIACVQIGEAWEPSALQSLEQLLTALPERVSVARRGPVLNEPDILQDLSQITGQKPDLLLLAAMHGGSARALTLAAAKSGLPTVIWCHDQRHSLASSALAAEALRQLDHPCILIHGDTEVATQELTAAAGAAAARQALARARIGQVGYIHPNLIGAATNPLVLQARFGAWVVPLALADLRERVAAIDDQRIAEQVGALQSDYDVQVADDPLQRAMAVHLALADIASEQQLDVLTVNCWQEIVPSLGISPCLGFAADQYRIGCEGDLAAATVIIAGEALTGKPGFVGDLYSVDEATGTAVLMHCAGCAALHTGLDPMVIAQQPPPGPVPGSGVVVACRPQLPTGPAVVVLLHGERLDHLHLRRCQMLDTQFPEQMQVQVQIEGPGDQFRREAAGNHYIVFPGDSAHAWRLWAKWSDITVH